MRIGLPAEIAGSLLPTIVTISDAPMAQHPTLRWTGGIDGHLLLLDQTRLPTDVVEIECRTVETVWEAIRTLRVRGAPAIGVAAAYGVCVALRSNANHHPKAPPSRTATQSTAEPSSDERPADEPSTDKQSGAGRGLRCSPAGEVARQACDYLATSRPTAVNLFWALDRMRGVVGAAAECTAEQLAERLLVEARAIHEEDRQQCAAIGRHGAELLADLPAGAGILTHCNAGALATGGDGTALAVIFALAAEGRRPHVFADETRPLLQGARLTMWELAERNIDATLICDNMAAQVMREGRVQAVITGADRIAANGDAANKIGTYGVGVLARAHNIPLYIAAPSSTFDLAIATGDDIPIEERPPEEITHGFGRATAPVGAQVYNPAFDVTPAELITAIVTERGVIQPVTHEQVAQTVAKV